MKIKKVKGGYQCGGKTYKTKAGAEKRMKEMKEKRKGMSNGATFE